MCCAGCSVGVQWYIFVVRFWVHFVTILRNVVFWFRNHIYSGQCGHSNAVCVLFNFLLVLVFFFLFVLIPKIDGKIEKKKIVNVNIMTRKLTGVNPKKYLIISQICPFSKCNARLLEANNYRKFQGDNPTLIINLMIVKC